MTAASLVWLRDDLRLADNPALHSAIAQGGPVAVLYLLDELSPGIRPLGGASRWWLHNSLESLASNLARVGGQLILRRGAALDVIPDLVESIGAQAVSWNRRYGDARAVDARVASLLGERGVEVSTHHANLLHEPGTITTGQGTPYKVFTPYWRACLDSPEPRAPFPAPDRITTVDYDGDELKEWGLLPTTPDWSGGLRDTWSVGESAATERLEHFARRILRDYHRRDEPGHESTSRLSPHLRFGEISPFQVWERMRAGLDPAARANVAAFLSELRWREFNWSFLFHFPELAPRNLRREFDDLPLPSKLSPRSIRTSDDFGVSIMARTLH